MNAVTPLNDTIKALKEIGPVNTNSLVSVALNEAFNRLPSQDVLDICLLIKTEQMQAWSQLEIHQAEQRGDAS